MGNHQSECSDGRRLKDNESCEFKVRTRQPFLSQMNLSSFVQNLSGRSFMSTASHQSTYSVSRPWSRISRRKWHENTLANAFEAAKTAWPVPFIEALFLPEFKIKSNMTDKDFVLVGMIAQGAFGKVYKVLNPNSGEHYALKVLSKSRIISENAINQVKDEVKIQSTCGHNPFIVNCPFYWQNRRRLFIVSEFMSGGELFQLSQRYGALPDDLVRIYVAEIAFALDFLHNGGVIFRDLKLENILLDSDGHLQLIDFGLAKWLKYGARTTTICGTLQYMAPEVVGTEPYGHAVDWWSLGVVTCCLLTTQFPEPCLSSASREDDIGEKILPGALPDSCVISESARKLLLRLLERDPILRLRSILKLQEVAFFKDFDFADARAKKFSPNAVLMKHFPDGPPGLETSLEIRNVGREIFENFDSILQEQ